MAELKDFSTLIGSLHNSAKLTDSVGDDTILIVNNKRQITAGKDLDTVIAYEGDINSQIITIKINRTYDAHDLSLCAYKELRWKNLGSGVEGISNLIEDKTNTSTDFLYLSWEVPSDACTQAGILEVSLTFYDKSGEFIAFAWNTAKYTGLSIGKTIESVNFAFPPKDEILVIDKDTKNIVAPVGYNNTICIYGDEGVTEVYFLVNRYLGKRNDLDIFAPDAIITVYVVIKDKQGRCSTDDEVSLIAKQLYTEEISNRNQEGLVLVRWSVPNGITAGSLGPGSFSIMLCFEQNGKKWYTNTYPNLAIGNSLFQYEPGETEEWSLFETAVETIIDKYFANNDFIIGDDK